MANLADLLTRLYEWGFWFLLPLTATYAVRRGSRPEREAAWYFSAAAAATLTIWTLFGHRWMNVQVGVLAIDSLLLLALIGLVIRFDRWWLIWAASFQAVATSAHFARWSHLDFDPAAYSIMEGFSAYPTIALLALATRRTVLARRTWNGSYAIRAAASWRTGY